MAVSAINASIEGLPNPAPIVAETNSTQDNNTLMDSFQSLTTSYQQAADMCSKYKAEVIKNLPILKHRHEKQSSHLKQLEAQVVQLRLEVLSSYSRYDQSKIEFDLCKKLQRHIVRELSLCDASDHQQSTADPIQSHPAARYSPNNNSQRVSPRTAPSSSPPAPSVTPLETCLHRLLSMTQYRPPVTQPAGDRMQNKRNSLESLFERAKIPDNHSTSTAAPASRPSAKPRISKSKSTRVARDDAFVAGNIDDIDEEEADQIDAQSDGEADDAHAPRRARGPHANGNQSSDSGSDTEALIYHDESNESAADSVRSSRAPSSVLPSQLETIYEGWVESQASQMFRVLLRQVRDEVLPSSLSRSSSKDSSHPQPLRYLYSRFHDEVYSRLWSDMIQARCHKVRVMQRLNQLLAEREQMFSKCDKLGKVVVCLELCLQPIELRDPAVVESSASMLNTLSEMYSSTTMAPSPAQAPLPPSAVPTDPSLASALPTIHESLSPRALSDSQQQPQPPSTSAAPLLSLLSQPAPAQSQSDPKPDAQSPSAPLALPPPVGADASAAKPETRSKPADVSSSSPSLSSALHSGVFAGVWEEIRIAYSLICKLEQARSLRDSYFLQLEALLGDGDADSQSKTSVSL